MTENEMGTVRPKTHYAATQTTPDIYAMHITLPANNASRGSWHQWVLNLTVSGRCELKVASGSALLEPGDVTVIKPHTWHGILVPSGAGREKSRAHSHSSAGEWEVIYTLFHPRPHWRMWLDALEYREGIAIVHLKGAAREAFDRDIRSLAQVYARGELLRDIRSLNRLDDALITLYEHCVRGNSHQDSRVHDAIEFIHAHYADPIGVVDIARVAGLSNSHFSAIFVNKLGVGPAEYLERLRLSRAAEMLGFSGAPVADIGKSIGYQNASYFTRRFRLQYGLTPREYRKYGRADIGSLERTK